jgi:hypothetical protein
MSNTVALDIVCNIYINISSKGQHKGKELKCIQSKRVILMMRLKFSYMDRLYAQWGQCGVFYGYQDNPASIYSGCLFFQSANSTAIGFYWLSACILNSLTAKSVLVGEKLVARYSIST